MRRLARRAATVIAAGAGVIVLVVVAALSYFAYVTAGGVAQTSGIRSGLDVDATVTIARDARGIAHIRARTDRDLFFAEGYAMAADRLFQMDLTRRYTEGRLAELLGMPLAGRDREMRSYDIARLAAAEYARVPPAERVALDAFAAGVNAAAAREPQPPEYRLLFSTFRPWRPQDAVEVGFATILDLDDGARSIFARDAIYRQLGMTGTDFFLPATDPHYDIPTNGQPPGPIAKLPDRAGSGAAFNARAQHAESRRDPLAPLVDARTTIGSNGWAVGAARSSNGHAMLANDPHLDVSVPGIWWLVEGRSPGYHIAGATLAGSIGVTLGHNEHVAWGVTAAETSAMRLVRERTRGEDELFEHGSWIRATHRRETIDVRLGRSQQFDVLSTPNGTLLERANGYAYLRDWYSARRTQDPYGTFLALARSRTVDDALHAMSALTDPALNFLAADDSGRVIYHLLGAIPVDDAWGRWAVSGDAARPPLLPFLHAPHVDPSRSAIIVSSNNRAAGQGSPRLAPFWPAPYRAYEVHRALRIFARAGGGKLSADAVAAPQRDDDSPAERELARLVVAAADRLHVQNDPAIHAAVDALRHFDGRISPDSRGATLTAALRIAMFRSLTSELSPEIARSYIAASTSLVVPLRALRERPRGWVTDWDRFAVDALRQSVNTVGSPTPRFGDWAAQKLAHPLAAFGLTAWNGPTLTGHGGAYAPAVQNAGHGQSFRAVWIVGDWDAGTIDIDAGESGEPGSPHYTDQSAGWQRFARTTLPFSDAAVGTATKTTLVLARSTSEGRPTPP